MKQGDERREGNEKWVKMWKEEVKEWQRGRLERGNGNRGIMEKTKKERR